MPSLVAAACHDKLLRHAKNASVVTEIEAELEGADVADHFSTRGSAERSEAPRVVESEPGVLHTDLPRLCQDLMTGLHERLSSQWWPRMRSVGAADVGDDHLFGRLGVDLVAKLARQVQDTV